MLPVIETYLKPRKWTIYFLFIGPLTMLIIYFTMPVKEDVLLYLFGGFTLLMGLIAWLISKTYVMVNNEGITARSVFTTKQMLWSDVTYSYLKLVNNGKSSQRYWYFENITGKKLRFPTSNYSRTSLTTIAAALTTRCPHTEIDQKIREFAEGRFPWYIF